MRVCTEATNGGRHKSVIVHNEPVCPLCQALYELQQAKLELEQVGRVHIKPLKEGKVAHG
jgi:hypothetical protein